MYFVLKKCGTGISFLFILLAAYRQLLKVLNPYKAVALCPLPVDTRVKGPVTVGRELEERDQEEDGGGTTEDKKLRFYRTFPEEGQSVSQGFLLG